MIGDSHGAGVIIMGLTGGEENWALAPLYRDFPIFHTALIQAEFDSRVTAITSKDRFDLRNRNRGTKYGLDQLPPSPYGAPMKTRILLSSLAAALLLAACGGDSTGPSSGSGRIDPAIAGTWAKANAAYFYDTLILTETKYQTPFASGVGTHFDAINGLSHSGPDMVLSGEYQLVTGGPKDTLYFKGLMGSPAPDATVPHTADNAYFRVP